jgi:AcrR family transcriptional regulator
MVTRAPRRERRTDALSKERIAEAAIEILDTGGESALTFRALAAHLATGAGAIYHHVANRNELLAAAAEDIIARVMTDVHRDAEPSEAIRTIALGLFDAIDAHPWVGAHLARMPWHSPMPQIFESIGGRLQALGVPNERSSTRHRRW